MPSARRSNSDADPVSDARTGYRLGLEASHRGEQTALEALNTALEAFLARTIHDGAADRQISHNGAVCADAIRRGRQQE
jgi:hypothetical protein